ncbi:phosphotriesterase family protein [Microbacterium karelineae]|uniref:phosphotriesterase family protein n=1 Tax=Microbacterium karelineae TaxID=2654283 RepID=UPI0012EAA461|nr:aryldialkylphosphatase [Microbacterium karelineae]
MTSVRTVLGDIPADALGPTNAHEHLFQVSPLLPGDEIDDPARSAEEAASLRDSGFAAMIDATPIGLGRRSAELAVISERTGLTVVAATGIHREAHYAEGHPLRAASSDERAALFLRDLQDGCPSSDAAAAEPARSPGGDPVRAGIVKTGIGYWSISAFELSTLEAAARAHAETGAPIMVHLEFCTAAHEVLDLLGGLGVAAERILLAHADRDPDPALHIELMARGAWLGYDGMARPRTRSDDELVTLTERVVAAGGDRILLGGDVARATRYVAYGGMPGLAYLGRRYLPRLAARIGDELVARFTTDNPRALLAF